MKYQDLHNVFTPKELCVFASVKARSVNLELRVCKQTYYEFRREATKEADNMRKDEEYFHENKKNKLTASDKGTWYENLTKSLKVQCYSTSQAYPSECVLVAA